MKDPFCMIVIGIFFVTTNEQCPINLENNILTNCIGMTKHGPIVYVDFYKINRPCNCTVTSWFDGELLVTSTKAIDYMCNTEVRVQKLFIFGCPTPAYSAEKLNVTINQMMDVQAKYKSPSTIIEYFYHCLGFQQNGEQNGNLSVLCGTPSEPTPRTTVSSPTITTSSVAITDESTAVTISSNTVNSSFDSLSIDSTQDNQEILYIVAGSAAGGAIILVGLVVLILIFIKRSRNGGNKSRSSEVNMRNTNKVFDNNTELPDNPLYLSSQPMDEFGYSSDQEMQLDLSPTDSKTKKKINSNYDVPPNNKPIDQSGSSMPVYAVPKRSKDRTPEVSTGDVYAEVCKPNRDTAQGSVRKRKEDGVL